MKTKKFPFKRWWLKVGINASVFITVFIVLLFTKLPTEFDSYLYYEDFRWDAWFHLFLYRIGIYFVYPFVVSIIESFVKCRKKVEFMNRVLENFNVQFLTYTIISALYSLIGFDKILDQDIFSTSDSFMFLGSFIVTLLINKTLPQLFYDEKES